MLTSTYGQALQATGFLIIPMGDVVPELVQVDLAWTIPVNDDGMGVV